MQCESTLEVMMLTHRCELEPGHAGEHRSELRHCTLCWENLPKPLDRATPDDSVFCQLCEPPHETSIAMMSAHLVEVHGLDPDDIANAPIVDLTEEDEAA
jgi:hypothetical protein